MITRRKTRQIKVGSVKVGGNAPVSIQSMAKTETQDVRRTVSEIRELEKAGCEIARVAVKNLDDAQAIKDIKNKIRIPLVADIHFNYKLALEAIKNGADKIRLNPGNIKDREETGQVIKAAKRARIPIRIGVNSGSSSDLVDTAVNHVKLFEEEDFRDIIISLKASDVVATIDAYRAIAKLCDYPLHLGVTAAGPHDSGIVKSSIGIGALLADGIGDTMRVSLTEDPVEEVIAAKRILSSLNIRNFGPDIISCPVCGRCQVDIVKIVKDLERKLSTLNSQLSTKRPVTVAIMGCEVNGPGESMDADIGIAAGKGSGELFVKGKIVRRVKEKDFVKELLKEFKKL